ncbi:MULTISPECIES: GH92 family glycosyl hydrolase [unclassified Streptomyces]|uniref:GH92 family glycosyl hydrolase n=1 Tax=unclassified Streptomyces TaxID=2593676 RepID=UPI0007C497A4|nr:MULTISPECIES: GH92 family glycosyl hydrolase [unclassified Streptomyces]
MYRRKWRHGRSGWTIGLLGLALLAGPAVGGANAAAHPPGKPAKPAADWHSSFETNDPQPDGRPATGPDGEPDVFGVVQPGSGERGLRTVVDDGPDRTYAAKADVGFTGLHALHYSARHEADGAAHATTVVADVNVRVGPHTELSYLLFPDFDEKKADYASTYAAVDLEFTDGSRLSGLNARDRYGDRLAARAQGDAKTVLPLQWNRRAADLGHVAKGRTVDRILLTYDGPKGPSDVGGWIDDISLDGHPSTPHRTSPADWVVTTRGTQSSGDYSRGNNFPATAVPNGFNFWTPETDAGSLGTLYSYNQQNNAQNLPEIQAFAASHETSIWMGDRQTFQVMPSTAEGAPDPGREARALAFRHEDETALPYHYGVTFTNGLRADMAPTDHAAVLRFTFPDHGGRKLVFDNVDDRAGLTIDAKSGTVSGWSETRTISAGMSRMYMYGTFDKSVTGSGMLTQGNRPSTGYVSFDGDSGRNGDTVTLRIATSLIGVDQARKNLELEIGAKDTLEKVAARAKAAWNARLGVVEVKGGSDDELTTLYSNLYRMNLYPNSAYENTGTASRPEYRHAVQSSGSWTPPASSPTRTGAEIADGKVFVNTGFWDTFRTAWPAYSLLWPRTAGELADGFVQQYRDGGWISPWSSPGYARVMTGTNSDAALADAYTKGVPGIDAEDTYDAALKNATVRPPDSSVGRDGLERSTFLGYVPNDVSAGYSWSIDGYVNDSAIAAMAEKRARQPGTSAKDRRRLSEEAEYFRDRSAGYADLYDPATGFFQGRSADGTSTTSADRYDPKVWGNSHDYTEADGWTEAFPAPEDGEGLAGLYGGRKALADKLDAYFATPEKADLPGTYGSAIHEMRETRDLRLGQWSIPNQVSYHIPYMYDYTQQPYKAQKTVREALDRGWLGSDIGQGYPGDEDNGATSSWWVLSSLGLYPLQTSSGDYVIGSPLFERATLHLPGGDVVIDAPNTSKGDIYVRNLTVDGKRHTSTAISHKELANGAHLRFTMGAKPSSWGTGRYDVPLSPTKTGQVPRPLHDVTGKDRGYASSASGQDMAPLFDNTSKTSLSLTGTDPEVAYQVNGGGRTEVTYYTLTSSDGAPDQDPGTWVLEGSDDGEHWKTLDRRSGERFRWRGQTRPFRIAHPASTERYRLRFTSADEQQKISLAEVELLTKDTIPTAPVKVSVADVALRPGTTASVEAELTNAGDSTLSPDLAVALPAGWTADPAHTRVENLAPGTAKTVTLAVTAAADATPGTQHIGVTASWTGWTVSGQGNAQVVGDVTEIEPNTDSEHDVLVADDGSQTTGDGAGGWARYTDNDTSFTYRLPVPAGSRGKVTLDIANQFQVEASTDGTHWTTVLREPDPVMFQSNRDRRTLDIADLRRQAGGDGSGLSLRFSDSRPEDGWGGWLAGVRVETAG